MSVCPAATFLWCAMNNEGLAREVREQQVTPCPVFTSPRSVSTVVQISIVCADFLMSCFSALFLVTGDLYEYKEMVID